MFDSPNKILAAALEVAAKGCRVMPVGTDKKPLIKDWPQKTTIEETQIRAWFDQGNPPNLAVTTGAASGFFALDIDGPEGQASLAALEQRHEPLKVEEMAIAITPSGGYHFYFQMPGFNLRNSAGKLGPGLDIRANGGYVLIPPSRAVGHGVRAEVPDQDNQGLQNGAKNGRRIKGPSLVAAQALLVKFLFGGSLPG